MTVEDIIATGELKTRPTRSADYRAENKLLHLVAAHSAKPPQVLLDRLVESANTFCRAGSAGLSLLEKDASGKEIFRWAAMAGAYQPFIGGTTPVDFSPCGTCLDRGAPQLYRKPARYFKYFGAVQPPIFEGLVIPITIGQQKLGTIWIVSHEEKRRFDGEDVRIMSSIATFTAAVLLQNQLRVTTENSLRQTKRSESFLQKVLGRSPDCIKVLDHAGRILYVNDPGLAAMRVKASDVLNKKWLQFWEGKDRALAKAAFQAAHEGKDGRFQGFRPTFKNEPRWWDVIITRLACDEAGRPTFLAISHDVTERVVAGRQIVEANNRLAAHAATLEQRVDERTKEVQCATERIQALARKLVRSQEDERRSLSRELHDEIGQQLTGLKLLLEERNFGSAGHAEETRAKSATIVTKLQKQVQTLSFALRQSLPDHIKLKTALQWHFKQLEQTAKMIVVFHCGPLTEERFGPEVRHTVFRVVQEALTNVIRHSKARRVQVSLSQDSDNVKLEIFDDGIGFKRHALEKISSAGLSGMEERIVLLGGRFSISSQKPAGTRISAAIPCPAGLQ